jgi:hypothetical protein
VFTAFNPADIDFADVQADLYCEVKRLTKVGSGWKFNGILPFAICIGPYGTLVDSSFAPTPASLIPKQALINVYIPGDNTCFAWAAVSALHSFDKHSEKILKYRPHLNSIDLSGLKFPVPFDLVARFQRNNPDHIR